MASNAMVPITIRDIKIKIKESKIQNCAANVHELDENLSLH
jgi:hypothetical protein